MRKFDETDLFAAPWHMSGATPPLTKISPPPFVPRSRLPLGLYYGAAMLIGISMWVLIIGSIRDILGF